MIYFISDTHFDHTNIIKYCNRPFASIEEMNNYMVEKWNSTVKDGDTVYFLGDLTFGRGRRPHKYWLDKLNGNIVFIKGKHDDGQLNEIKYHFTFTVVYKGKEFFLVHNFAHIPSNWNGWVVHGHSHNNEPFINKETKRVNVSAEIVDYTPVSIDDIIEVMK